MKPPQERKRILALDGGGVKAMLTLAILERMESLLREHHGNPDLILADHFQFISGTSTCSNPLSSAPRFAGIGLMWRRWMCLTSAPRARARPRAGRPCAGTSRPS